VPKTATSPQYKVQVLERALGLLNTLAEAQTDLSLMDLCERIKLHKSTVHRLISVLEQSRFVERTSSGKYRLGLKLFELGSRAVSGLDLRERARIHLERLAFETNETVHLCVLDEGEVLYLDKVEPDRSVRLSSSVGRRNPAHCTSVGKAIMAFMPESEVDSIIQQHGLRAFTKYTITTPAALKADLQEARQVGYAKDWEEHEEGVKCLGSAVFDYSGKAVAAISLSGPAFRINDKSLNVFAAAVKSACAALSADLGWFVESEGGRAQTAG
jgi:IclR family transcriptional regulator, KDG regulon repressor